MKDKDLAKSHLLENNLNFVLARENETLLESSGRGIKPIFDAYRDHKESLKGGAVADRVIGKAASMFLIEGEIKSLYTDLISDVAYDLLTSNDIEVEYLKKVPMILNRTGDDICPMENISNNSKDVDELIKGIEDFFNNIK
ncbi:MAG: DUF1893 domain-containing protein [Tissierellaceae bacterium]|nr:DUF1893 domain-containing protein [Tissierellaceae bacterium]